MIGRLIPIFLAAALMAGGCAGPDRGLRDGGKPGFQTRSQTRPAPSETPPPKPEAPLIKVIKGMPVDSLEEGRRQMARQAATRRPGGMGARLRSLVLKDVPVRNIVELMTEVFGFNVLATNAVADRPVDIYLRNLTLQNAIEAICRLNDLWYRQGDGIITLMTRAEYLRDIKVRQSEQTRAFYVRYTNAVDMAKVIRASMGEQVHLAIIADEKIYGHIDPEEEAAVDNDETPELTAAAARERNTGLPAGAPGGGGRSDGNKAAVAEAARKKPLLAVLTVFKRNNCIVARSLDGALLNEIAEIIGALDTPTSQILLEVRILQLTLNDDFESFFELGYSDTGHDRLAGNYDTGVNLLNNGLAGPAGLNFFFDGDKLDARIAFFKKTGRAEIISTPFLMAANNSKVEFFVGEETPLRDDVTTKTVPIGDTGNTITTFEVDIKREELGTDVMLTTFINEDDTVTLEIEVEISTAKLNFSTVQVVNEKSGRVLDFPIDGVDKSTIKSILSARSGQSIAIGGIIRESRDAGETKVPVLGDIPAIGNLFKKIGDDKQKTETVIILTPHVISHPALAGRISERFLERKSSHVQVVEKKENILGK